MSIVYVYMSAAVGSSSSDILPEIIIPPSPTSCTENVESVKIECVANARYECRKEEKYGF